MIPEFLRTSIWGELALIVIIAIGSVGVAYLVVFAFDKVLTAITSKTRTSLDDLLIEALRRPIFFLVFVAGLYVAVTTVTFLDKAQGVINKVVLAVGLFLVVQGVNRAVGAVIKWYAIEIAPKTKSDLDEKLIPIVRRVSTGAIYGVGFLMIFRAIGFDISPLLAGLGIGGLAVALALQPTLNNLIAGGFTASESGIGVGNYIRVEDGQRPEGVVEDIGWRTTKIRTSQNNIVVIPNAKLADSVITNFGAPTPELSASVRCGVSYGSDLDRVQNIVADVARQVLQATPGAIGDSEPMIRFVAFGDSNIDFEVWFRVKDYGSQFNVRTALIKALHRRFKQEGIEIDYPVRRVISTS